MKKRANDNKLNNCQEALLKLLSFSLFDEQVDFPFGDEKNMQLFLEQIYKESVQQAVPLIVWDAIGKFTNRNVAKSSSELRRYSARMLRQNLSVFADHNYLHKLMTESNIDYCFLKGCSSAYYYKNPMLRAMGDVDFLVKKEDVDRACEVLEAEGFERWKEEHICHIVFKKGRMHFELHFEPAGVPDGKARDIILGYFDDIFEKSVPLKLEGNSFVMPSDFHHGLVILLHTYHHMLSEGVGLRHLCDLAVFFNGFTDEEFKELFYDRLSGVGLWKFAQIMAQVCCEYLSLPYRSWMGDINKQLCAELIFDIFSGGNFGAKDENREMAGTAISDRGKQGVSGGSVIQAIKSLNDAAVSEISAVRKLKFLKPFGWIMIIFRYTFRVITGKRESVGLFDILNQSRKRKNIYKNFELYEFEEKL